MSWANRLFNLFRRERVDAEAEEEAQFHLVARMEENLARGMSLEDARRDAARRFGGGLQARERSRDADLVIWLDTLARDIRFAFRNLAKNRGVTLVAALSLALGIGANTAIFSAIHAILLRPLPYPEPGRLAMLWMDNRRLGLHEDLTSFPNYEDWKKSRVFEDLAGFVPSEVILTGLEEPARIPGAAVTWNFLSVLGVPPMLGRNFTAEEDQAGQAQVVILSYGLWQREFGGDRHVVGKTIEIGNKPYSVVGVMPADFAFPTKDSQLWRPLGLSATDRAHRDGYFLSVIGRMRPGVTRERAQAEMAAVGARLEAQYPDSNKGYGVWVVPLLEQVVGTMRQVLLVLLGAVAFVLLIACVNVANLFLGRGAARGREIAVRAALGAGRIRLVRQLLTESAVLSLFAGVLGLAIALFGIRGLVLLAPKDLPRLDQIAIDVPVLVFTLAVSLVAAILCGMLPALRVSGVDLNEALREGGRSLAGGKRSRHMRSALTVAEIAFSMILLTGAGLMIRSLLRLQSIHPGFRTENVLTWRIAPSRTKFPSRPQVVGFYADLLQRLQSIPSVLGAGATSDIFLSETPNSASFSVEGRPDPPPEQQIEATRDTISLNYFQTMGVTLIRGRFFNEHDGPDSTPVVIINETMAKRFWPGEDAVGRRYKLGDADSHAPWLTVVGIVADMRRQGLEKLARCETFLPMAQRPAIGMAVVVHTASDPAKVVGPVRDAARALDKSAVMFERSTIADQIGESLSQRRFETLLLGLFSLLALTLAAVGIYGVVYQSVSQRTNEIGIRVALGARKSGLLGMVVGETLARVGLGAVLGGAAALVLSRTLSSFLYAVTAADPLTYAAVMVLLLLAAALASLIPARRATGVDPVEALRYE
ncbi:MAG TPA: ABC transporter permease [Bryobacteraceae bacterium]|nr:ABC transporter permease [Bryobacteraceae bacterium]